MNCKSAIARTTLPVVQSTRGSPGAVVGAAPPSVAGVLVCLRPGLFYCAPGARKIALPELHRRNYKAEFSEAQDG
ncbi:MAG: hypothetical protein HRF47_13790 [Chloroflexota bacterium]|jgi:hypothetical protein